jgi:hypothetical protein
MVVVCCIAPLFAACAKQPMQSDPIESDELDHQLMLNTFVEDGKLVTLAVNVDATRRREKSPLVPVGIVIANNGGQRLSVNRESLTLVDDEGRRYPVATVQEVRKLGSRATTDLQASRRFVEVFANRLQALNRVSSVFFPLQIPGDPRRGVVRDQIELSSQHWLIDVIYFPHPEGKLLGRKYELWFSPRELADPVFVRFSVE